MHGKVRRQSDYHLWQKVYYPTVYLSHTCTNTHFYPSIVLSEWRQYSHDICSVCRERKDDLTDAVIPHTQRATLSDEKKTGKKKRGNALKEKTQRRRGREIQKEHHMRQNGSVTSAGNVSTCSSARRTDLFWLWVIDDSEPSEHRARSH